MGAISVTLGKRILRTETAPIVLTSILLYEYDAMKKKKIQKEKIEQDQMTPEQEALVVAKMETEIRKKQQLPEEEQNKIHKKIAQNLFIAIGVMAFFYSIGLGARNIEATIYEVDLKVFSMGFVGFAILLFEVAYRKDRGDIAIHGIEVLIIAITMLGLTYGFVVWKEKFPGIVAIISYIFAIYYVAKTIVIQVKMKKQYRESQNDIHEIIKK